MIEKEDLAEIMKMMLTMQKEIVSEMANTFLTIEREHFRENVLWVRKGRRQQMEYFVNHMKICLKSVDKDLARNVEKESVLNTTIGAMKSLVEVCEDELSKNPLQGEMEKRMG